MKSKTCPNCGATWIDGQLYWATGQPALEEDLAGLVCNRVDSNDCINPQRGSENGVTLAWRINAIKALNEEHDL